jgi:ribosomal protein S18 acetylase RimI-like enzyme
VIEIRTATNDDLRRLCAIHESWDAITPMGLKKLTAVSGRHCKAIDLDGHTVGLLIVQLSTRDARIIRLVIDPAFRRRGIGRAAVAWCRQRLRADRKFLIAHVPAPTAEQVDFFFAVGFFCCAVHGGKHKSFTYTLEAQEVEA